MLEANIVLTFEERKPASSDFSGFHKALVNLYFEFLLLALVLLREAFAIPHATPAIFAADPLEMTESAEDESLLANASTFLVRLSTRSN